MAFIGVKLVSVFILGYLLCSLQILAVIADSKESAPSAYIDINFSNTTFNCDSALCGIGLTVIGVAGIAYFTVPYIAAVVAAKTMIAGSTITVGSLTITAGPAAVAVAGGTAAVTTAAVVDSVKPTAWPVIRSFIWGS